MREKVSLPLGLEGEFWKRYIKQANAHELGEFMPAFFLLYHAPHGVGKINLAMTVDEEKC